jgi:hypothetical protein
MNEAPPINRRSFKIIRIVVNIGFWIGVAALAAIIVVSLVAPQLEMAFSIEGLIFLPLSGVEIGWGTTALYILWILVGLAFLWALKRILNSMKHGTPFTEENAKRLFAMGALALAQSYIGQWNTYRLAQSMFDYSVQNALVPLIRPQFQILPSSALLAFCLLVLAEVFRYGSVLQQEHDTTV